MLHKNVKTIFGMSKEWYLTIIVSYSLASVSHFCILMVFVLISGFYGASIGS